MKEVVSCILNIVVTCLVAFLLNLHLVEKRRYQELNELNVVLDVLLKANELEDKNVPIVDYVRRRIEELYESTKED
ncbi:MAG: hypothetical protein ACTTH8_08390 [Treponema sp.]